MRRCTAIALVLIVAVPSLADQAPQFGETIEVNVTNVDVIVTDRTGAHVHGLTRNDFEVFDDGVRQNVTNFSEYRGGADIEMIAMNEQSETKGNPPPARRPVMVLIFIDNGHLQLKNRARALAAIGRLLDAQGSDGVRAIVIRFNGRSAARPMVGDAASIAAALPSVMSAEPPGEIHWKVERRHYEDLIDGATLWYVALEYAKQYAESTRADMVRTLDALRASIDSLRGFDGRKMVLYVTEGVSQIAGAEMLAYWEERFEHSGEDRGHGFTPGTLEFLQFDVSRDLQRIADAANAAGVSLYAFDVKGTQSDEFDIQSRSRREDEALRSTRGSAMNFLAASTGGAFIHNQNAFDEPLAAVADDFRDYYSIGYRTPKGKKATHRIEVRAKRPDLFVRTRQQYVVTTQQQRIAAQVESMFVVPLADANPLAVAVERGPLKNDGRTTRIVPLIVRVPRQRLTAAGGGHVTLYLQATDGAGGRTPLRSAGRDLPQRGDLVIPLTLKMRRGANSLVVAVRDDVSGTLSLVRLDETID